PLGGTSPRPCTGKVIGAACLVADREALADMGRALDLVGECNREVLTGNRAVAVGCGQKLVCSEAELSGSLAGGEQGRGRQKSPVQFLFGPKQVKERRPFLRFGLVCHGKAGGGDQPD